MSELNVTKIENEADSSAVEINRKASDGTIIDLQKDGTTVGLIGSTGGALLHIGLREDATNPVGLGGSGSGTGTIMPVTTSGSERDAAINLGKSTARWKDLYLSGGVYLGGTGAANYLDDYEEGTWTPVWTDSGGGTYTGTLGAMNGRYTKVGRICYFYFVAQAQQSLTSNGLTGGNQVYIDGLPFTKVNAEPQAVGYAEMYADIPTGATQHGFFIRNNVDYVAFRYSGDDFSANNTTVDHVENGASRTIQVSGFFEVA